MIKFRPQARDRECDTIMEPEYINAKQCYEVFGISRSTLGHLTDAGRVEKKTINDGFAVLNLYRVADLRKVIEGGDNDRA